jgi:ribosomal protein L16 Arg81 hydroxylase
MNNTITAKELELLFEKLFQKIKKDNVADFSFDYDEYWIITTDEWNKFDGVPEPAVGSLVDDIRFLKSVIEDDVMISYLELERLASVLRAISEKVLN